MAARKHARPLVHSRDFTMRISREDHKKLDMLAFTQGLTKAGMIRSWIREHWNVVGLIRKNRKKRGA